MPVFVDNQHHVLVDYLRDLLSKATAAYFALAFVRQSGTNLLVRDITRLIERGGTVSLLFGDDFGATEGHAIETLRSVGVSLKYYMGPQSFHPKGYILTISGETWAIIGSSNLSAVSCSSSRSFFSWY